MPKDVKFLNLAKEFSLESTAKNQKMCSLVIKNGKIISLGLNLGFKHCEVRALKPHMDYRGCDLVVARWNGGMSRPCVKCQKKIIEAGIRRCYYNAWDGSIVKEVFSAAS